MSLNRKFVGFSLSFALIFLILFCVLIFGYFYIPIYVESTLIPELAKKARIPYYTCDVRRIGFLGADFDSVRIKTETNTSLSIDSVQIDYSIKGLYNKKIRRAVLSGIELFCEYTGKEWGYRSNVWEYETPNLSENVGQSRSHKGQNRVTGFKIKTASGIRKK